MEGQRPMHTWKTTRLCHFLFTQGDSPGPEPVCKAKRQPPNSNKCSIHGCPAVFSCIPFRQPRYCSFLPLSFVRLERSCKVWSFVKVLSTLLQDVPGCACKCCKTCSVEFANFARLGTWSVRVLLMSVPFFTYTFGLMSSLMFMSKTCIHVYISYSVYRCYYVNVIINVHAQCLCLCPCFYYW